MYRGSLYVGRIDAGKSGRKERCRHETVIRYPLEVWVHPVTERRRTSVLMSSRARTCFSKNKHNAQSHQLGKGKYGPLQG